MKHRRKIALLTVIGCILIIALAVETLRGPPASSFPPSIVTAPQCSTGSDSMLPCGFVSGKSNSDILVIVSANLTVSPSKDGSGTLTMTLVHSGNYEGTELGVVIWPTALGGGPDYRGVLNARAAGQEGTYTAPIPSSFGLVRGQSYKLTVDSTTTGPPPEGGITEELDITMLAR